ncbi:hypothetical protein BOTBODRAFT_116159 [Botryobasidium botryosum FD-172 SS1]|uniref:Cyclin N-terminal domain-containing protein n=1 Tax=Botryobasidium botryosum (strain FD-172 SS1) TaxID=930990 RepID=A0A067M3L3_BOTB1|nr:hypothetical protein BOTBODRAFT_116159 [Botryobasidium botryosum FD-172 SS1]
MAHKILYPLASLGQIKETPSRADGLSQELEDDLRAYGCKIIQQAGLLLRQKQVAMATAQILFQRFWYVTSMTQFGISDVGMGALYLASKLEECPVRMRDLINVFDLLLSRARHGLSSTSSTSEFEYTPMTYFSSTFYDLKEALVISEMQILKRLGFNVQAQLPYGTMVNYLRLLGLDEHPDAAQKAWGYLNDALQTPVYALYPIPTIACAAILLTTRTLSLPLPAGWYLLFDAELEDMMSICGMIMRLYRDRPESERARWVRLAVGGKREVRKWLSENVRSDVQGDR